MGELSSSGRVAFCSQTGTQLTATHPCPFQVLLLPSLGVLDPSSSSVAVPPHLPLLSGLFSSSVQLDVGWMEPFLFCALGSKVERVCKRSAGVGSGRPISHCGFLGTMQPGCFLTLSTYPGGKEKWPNSVLLPLPSGESVRGGGAGVGGSEVGCRWRTLLRGPYCGRRVEGAPWGTCTSGDRRQGQPGTARETPHFPS